MATYLAVAVVIAVLYGVSAWAMAVSAGQDKIVSVSADDGPEALFNLAGAQLGSGASTLGHVFLLTSLVAALISVHNTTARYIFALGRERVLSAFFGSTSASGAPLAGSIAQTSIALLTVLVYVVFNLDPAVQLFFVGGTLGGLGILVLLITTSVSVVLFFARNRRGETAWHTLIAPVLAVLGVGGSLAGLDPRHHLWFLAVKPELQGHGLGALLLAQHDRVLDDDGVAGYLDASSPRSRQLYLRHGYRDVREPFVLPDGGPPSFPHVAGTWRRRMNQLAS